MYLANVTDVHVRVRVRVRVGVHTCMYIPVSIAARNRFSLATGIATLMHFAVYFESCTEQRWAWF